MRLQLFLLRRPLFRLFPMQQQLQEAILTANMRHRLNLGFLSHKLQLRVNRPFINLSMLQHRLNRAIHIPRRRFPLHSRNINQQLRCTALLATILPPIRLRNRPILLIKVLR
jgi:hypothetical protein